jgi:predicted transcriptional regulator
MRESVDFEEQKIRDLIAENPGLYLSKIAEMLDMSISTVEQYLREMERKRIIYGTVDEGYKKYYIDDSGAGIYGRKILEIRKKIYNFIAENPGLNLSKIAELLNMGISLAEYHLLYLEKNESIISIKEEGYKRYYVKSTKLGIPERKILALMRQELPLKIVLLLLKHTNLKHKELLEHFDIAPSTLSYHLHKLLQDNVIDVHTYGKEKGYSIRNKRMVLEFLMKYKLSSMVESLKDTWDDFNYKL